MHSLVIRTAVFSAALFLALSVAKGQEPAKPAGKPEEPRLKLARLTKEHIEQQEKDLTRLQEEVIQAIEQMGPGRFDQEQLAVESLRRLIVQLRAMAKVIRDKHEEYVSAAKTLKASSEAAVPVFLHAGKVFEEYAKEEPYKDLKEDYLSCANFWRDLSSLMERRGREFVGEPEEIAEAVRYIGRSSLFLERFDAHLASYPVSNAGAERQRFIEQMKRYFMAFQEFRKAFRKFNDKLRSDAIVPEIRPKKSAARNTPAHRFRVSLIKDNWYVLFASRSDGLSLTQRVPFYRGYTGEPIGTLEIVKDWGPNLLVRGVSGEPLSTGDTINTMVKQFALALR